jgi:hypothetical protein
MSFGLIIRYVVIIGFIILCISGAVGITFVVLTNKMRRRISHEEKTPKTIAPHDTNLN